MVDSLRFYHLLWTALDWLYPPLCGGCGKKGARWCTDCQAATTVIVDPVCPCCGRAVVRPGYCAQCRDRSSSPLTALRSWAVFTGPLRNAIHCLKYKGNVSLGEALAYPLIELLKHLNWPVDFVTAVPLGVARQAERGYNQANLLARPLALSVKRPFYPQALVKTRETRPQVGLNAAERQANVAQAFGSVEKLASDRHVLVLDDVTTTGATLEACALALRRAGAREVYGLTLARARLDGLGQI